MQQNISNKIQLGNILNPYRIMEASLLLTMREIWKIYSKVDEIGAFWKTGKADEDLSRYIPNILPVMRQNQIVGTIPTILT